MTKLHCVVVLAVLVGCGTDGPGTGPISAADATAGCQAVCEHQQTCTPTSTDTVAACTADCVASAGAGGVREDAFQALSTCVANQACSATTDTCLYECELTPAHDTYSSRCIDTALACGSSSAQCAVAPGGDAAFLCLYTPAVMAALTACFDLPCADIGACQQRVATMYNIDG